ncbi:MAG TPA: type II toxin-antitoxin system VapC family toxin [Candidatus Angelobacter sp.]
MSGFLLDTNCISEAISARPSPNVESWMQSVDQALLYLSVLTLGEIRKGLARLAQGQRRTRLESWLEIEVQARFSGRILPIDAAIADRWGLLEAEARRKGRPLSTIDGLLAATALHYNLTMVTRNVTDLTDLYIPVLNPWEA